MALVLSEDFNGFQGDEHLDETNTAFDNDIGSYYVVAQADSSVILDGSCAWFNTPDAAQAALRHNTSSLKSIYYLRFYFLPWTATDNNQFIVIIFNQSDSQSAGMWFNGDDASLNIRDGISTVASTSPLTWTYWHRIEWKLYAGNEQRIRLFYPDNVHGTIPDEEYSGSLGSGLDHYVSYIDIGQAWPRADWSCGMDSIAYDDAEWVGPAVSPQTVEPSSIGSNLNILGPTVNVDGPDLFPSSIGSQSSVSAPTLQTDPADTIVHVEQGIQSRGNFLGTITFGDLFEGDSGDPLDDSYIIALSQDKTSDPTLTGGGGVVHDSGQGGSFAVQDLNVSDANLTIGGQWTSDTVRNWGLVARVQLPLAYSDNTDFHSILESGYQLEWTNWDDTFALYRDGSEVASTTISLSADFTVRLRVDGDMVQARLWHTSDPEPDTWDIEYTDSSPLSAGAAGFGVHNSANRPVTQLAPFTASYEGVITPSISTGPVSVFPVGITSTSDVASPTLIADQFIYPTRISSRASVASPALYHYILHPPTVSEAPAGDNILHWRYKLKRGVSIVKQQDGSFLQVRYPDQDLTLDAAHVYTGGHSHNLDIGEVEDLRQAGYDEYIEAVAP